jgi:hypothetical protein
VGENVWVTFLECWVAIVGSGSVKGIRVRVPVKSVFGHLLATLNRIPLIEPLNRLLLRPLNSSGNQDSPPRHRGTEKMEEEKTMLRAFKIRSTESKIPATLLGGRWEGEE